MDLHSEYFDNHQFFYFDVSDIINPMFLYDFLSDFSKFFFYKWDVEKHYTHEHWLKVTK